MEEKPDGKQMTLKEKIENLPKSKIPKNYQWDRTKGVLLKDIGFIHVQDLLHKKKFKQVNPFPDDFDVRIFKRRKVFKRVKMFLNINPENFVMAQSHLDKKHLLDLIDEPNIKPARILKCGRYHVVADGHHRIALKYLKRQKIYAIVSILE